MDEGVANAVLQVDDPEIVLDLRRTNGEPNSSVLINFGMSSRCTLMK